MTPAEVLRPEQLVADLGFLVHRDLPRDGRDAVLVIAVRDQPTERHFDPEVITYWRTDARGRGVRAEITATSAMPVAARFSWGAIETVDRFGVTNTFVSFGGQLAAWRQDRGTVITTWSSPGPILCRGGHSQGYDHLAAEVSAFFARLLVPIDFVPGAERLVATATPLTRYAAFLRHDVGLLRSSDRVRELHGPDARLVSAEGERIRRDEPMAWEAGTQLLAQLGLHDSARVTAPSQRR